MALHEILATKCDAVMQCWRTLVRGKLAPEAMPSFELMDHLPEFLNETLMALREAAGVAVSAALPVHSTTAAGHGAQRLRLGFSLDAVVREYGALRDAIIATARDAGEAPTLDEVQIVFDCMIVGIAHA